MERRRSLIRKIARIPLSITRRRGSEKCRRSARKKKGRKIGRSGNMTWHRSYRSIGKGMGRKMVASTTAPLVFAVGRRSFFGDTWKIYFNRRARGDTRAARTPTTHTGRSVYAREKRIRDTATRVTRMCRQTGFDISCLCNYARPVSGRTLIELRCIMIITFDTAMPDTFRIN